MKNKLAINLIEKARYINSIYGLVGALGLIGLTLFEYFVSIKEMHGVAISLLWATYVLGTTLWAFWALIEILDHFNDDGKRIPVSQLMLDAEKLGWTFTKAPTNDLKKFFDSLRLAIIDEQVIAYGRISEGQQETEIRNKVLKKIPQDHWDAYVISVGDNTLGYQKDGLPSFIPTDNYHVRTRKNNMDKHNTYWDMHVKNCNKRMLKEWLK